MREEAEEREFAVGSHDDWADATRFLSKAEKKGLVEKKRTLTSDLTMPWKIRRGEEHVGGVVFGLVILQVRGGGGGEPCFVEK